MRRDIAGDRDEDAQAFIRVAPEAELREPRLQHLVGVEARDSRSTASASVAISGCGEWPSAKPELRESSGIPESSKF